MMFQTDYQAIRNLITQIKPTSYVKNRNYIDGDVTKLSPYISRGVISTKQIFDYVQQKEFDLKQIEHFIQELAWRDYWQQVWMAKKEAINQAIRQPQVDVQNYAIPQAILEGTTQIDAIDKAIQRLYETGYMHNHLRMYSAAIACNMAKSHWLLPAKWMYYHLLDGDWASNALSWQWVAGANSSKKYYANQDNINTHCYTKQKGTFLDVPYNQFDTLPIPSRLATTVIPTFKTILPQNKTLLLDPTLPTYIYTTYNLDPRWGTEEKANRILLLEPSHFENYPISGKVMQFILDLSKNIPAIQVHCNEFENLIEEYNLNDIHYKEHPLTTHFKGTQHQRDWMFTVEGYYPSFFSFWKKCRREIE